MGNGYIVPPTGDYGVLFQIIEDLKVRIEELERPTGSQVAQALKKLQELVAGLITQVNGIFSGYVSAGTTISAGTNITAGGNITAGAGIVLGNVLKTTTGPTTNITAARVTSWLQNSDGLVGTATSSERFKANIRAVRDDPDFDPLAVLDLSIDFWEYRAEIAKRDDPDSADYVGPEYHVGLNFGPIAERAHELGLWMIVVYERESDGMTLRLNEDGEPIPYGLHDVLFGYLVSMAAQVIHERQEQDRARLDGFAARLFALDGQAEVSSL